MRRWRRRSGAHPRRAVDARARGGLRRREPLPPGSLRSRNVPANGVDRARPSPLRTTTPFRVPDGRAPMTVRPWRPTTPSSRDLEPGAPGGRRSRAPRGAAERRRRNPRTSPAFSPILEERLDHAPLRRQGHRRQGLEPERPARASQHALLLQAPGPVVESIRCLDPFQASDRLIPVENEDDGARADLLQVCAETVLQLGYAGLLHMAIIARYHALATGAAPSRS